MFRKNQAEEGIRLMQIIAGDSNHFNYDNARDVLKALGQEI